MSKPDKETHVFKVGQVEEHEIALIVEEIECPNCGGGGDVTDDDLEGNEYTEQCRECNGAGVLYVSIESRDRR